MPQRLKHRRLLRLQGEFDARLRPALQKVRDGQAPMFFFTPAFNPYRLPESQLSAEFAELLSLAAELVALRRSLRVEPPDSVEARLLALPRNPELGPPRVTAARFAAELLRLMETAVE